MNLTWTSEEFPRIFDEMLTNPESFPRFHKKFRIVSLIFNHTILLILIPLKSLSIPKEFHRMQKLLNFNFSFFKSLFSPSATLTLIFTRYISKIKLLN